MAEYLEREQIRLAFQAMARWARANPGTPGLPKSLEDGGPGDSDCMATYLASICHAAGQKVRFVMLREPAPSGTVMGESTPTHHRMAILVEVFHASFGPDGCWLPILPFGPFIFEGPEILGWERIMEYEVGKIGTAD